MDQRLRAVSAKGLASVELDAVPGEGQLGQDLSQALAGPTLEQLVRLQRADGRWVLDARLAGSLGLDLGRLAGVVGAHPGLQGKGDLVATLAALLALQKRFADREDEWRMLAAKAESWLAREFGKLAPTDLRKLLEGALTSLF
jgi:hypothetical protein